MRLKARYTLLFALSCCTASRPDGAFTPKPEEPPSGFEQRDGGKEDPDTLPEEEPDGGDEPEQDTSVDEPDAGPVDTSNPLAKLAGRYLMRMDYYSTASASSQGNTLTLQNRVSNLFFTEIKLVNGTLEASEQLCDQSYEHYCQKGCGEWKTQVDNLLPAKFRERVVERAYAVDEQGVLTAPQAFMPLGYDDPEPDSNPPPSQYTDANVWKLDENMSDPYRVGLRTFITADLKAALGALSIPFTCLIDSAQLFATSFRTSLQTLDAKGLSAATIPLDIAGQRANALYADGDPMMYCNKDVLATGTSNDETAFVRFKTAGSLTGCPVSAAAFEQAFPANPKFR